MTGSGWIGVALIALCAVAAFGADAPAKGYPAPKDLPMQKDLPNPLVSFAGKPVTTKGQWERDRRPELKRLFQQYMYGWMPPAPGNTRGVVDREDPRALGGNATLREVTVTFGPERTPPIHLLVVVPNAAKRPVPTFLGLNFCGNHAVLKDPGILIPDAWMYPNYPGVLNNRATAAGRGSAVDTWNVQAVIDRGYAFATFYSGEVDPDRPDFSDGVHPFFLKPGQTQHDPGDWGTVAAWAWGMQRALDYLVTDPAIDPKQVVAVGHSRMGKASLVAAAFDERFAMAIPLQAGCGGTSPSRGKIGESVQRINTSFPHWFNDKFKQFNEEPERLPFDQHCLIALMAPRPVLLSNAVEDTWANPEGQFEMLKAADPVYRLVGADGLASDHMPPTGQLLASRLGYFIRPGKHSMTLIDWQAFMDYADRFLKR